MVITFVFRRRERCTGKYAKRRCSKVLISIVYKHFTCLSALVLIVGLVVGLSSSMGNNNLI